MSLDFLEFERMPDKKWWKQARKEIEDAKKEFIKSGKIGGNPLGVPDDTLKKELEK